SIFNIFNTSFLREKNFVEDDKEIKNGYKPDTQFDSLIVHYRKWQDYDRKIYEGKYWVKVSDYKDASLFKNNFNVNDANYSNDPFENYNYTIHSLKENDKNKLHGLYQLFDSIQNNNNLSKMQFANMIVSF